MNTLSVFLYLGGIVQAVSITMFMLSGAAFLWALFNWIGVWKGIICNMFGSHPSIFGLKSHTRQEFIEAAINAARPKDTGTKLILLLGAVIAVFASLLPSQDTVYLIAASELGESALASEEFQEVFQIIKERLKSELSQ